MRTNLNPASHTVDLEQPLVPPQADKTAKAPQSSSSGVLSSLTPKRTADKQDAPDSVVVKSYAFEDGSARADRLVAQRNRQSNIFTKGKDGEPVMVKGGNYGLPQFEMPNAKGNEPHTDSHMHPTNYVQQGLSPHATLKMMDEIGIRVSTLMPIPTSLQVIAQDAQSRARGELPRVAINPRQLTKELGESSGGADHLHDCGLESYYVPKAVQEREMKLNGGKPLSMDDFKRNPGLVAEIVARSELYLDTAVNSHLASQINKAGLSAAERSRLDPMITGINLGDLRAGAKLLAELYHNKGVFTGIGEITVHKELVEDMYAGQRGQANTLGKGNALAGLTNLLEMAGVVGMPVVLHCDIDNLHAQIAEGRAAEGKGKAPAAREPANFAGLSAMFNDPRVKDTKIVWAHGGGLGRFVQQGPGHLDRLSKLLGECPNLYLDISWSEVAKQINKPEQQKAWIGFLEKNSTRICFGSDTLAPANTDKWNETKAMYRAVLDQLSPEAKGNILNHTYEGVFVASRAKVRDFENKVLTPQFFEQHLLNPNAEQPVSKATVEAALAAAKAHA